MIAFCRPLRLYERTNKQMKALEFFMTNSWKFATDNASLLHDSLSVKDRTEFSFKMQNFNWNVYAEIYVLGARRYIMKETDSTICAAKKSMKILKLRTTCWKPLLIGCVMLVGIVLAKFARIYADKTGVIKQEELQREFPTMDVKLNEQQISLRKTEFFLTNSSVVT